MKRIKRDKLVYFFDKKNEPALEVEVNEPFVVETQDAQNGRIKTENDVLKELINLDYVNPCTGPIFVKGAEPGDTIVVEILNIEVKNEGFICVMPGDGILRDYYTQSYTKIFKITKDTAIFNENIEFPIKPMIGTIGTTPLQSIPTGRSGIHGGNMDAPTAGMGAKIHFPVFVPGALLIAGDVHARQCDSEFSMGLECAADITIKVTEIKKGKQIPCPFIELPESWATVATGNTLGEAIVTASKDMADFLMERLGININEVGVLLSCVGDVKICQSTGIGLYTSTVRIEVPKTIDKLNRLN